MHKLFSVLLFVLLSASLASADTVGEFRFTGTLGLLPSTETFTAGSSLPALVLIGQDGTALTPLFAKDSASDEDGIGLANSGSAHEITGNYTIQVNLKPFIALGVDSITFLMNSIQGNPNSIQGSDSYRMWASTSADERGTLLLQNFSPTLTLSKVDLGFLPGDYITIGALQGDVLLEGVDVGLPEPSALGQLLAGLVGLGLFFLVRSYF